MTIAESDGTRLAYIAEVTEGTTPATPVFKTLRYTSESLKAAKNSLQSNEIRSDKNIADIIAAGESISGGIDAEMSYGTFDDLIEAACRGTWSTDVLKNGVARKSFTIEKTFEIGAASYAYLRYRGCFINSMTIDMQPRSPISVSFDILGMGSDAAAAAIISGATYTAATTEEVMPSGTYIGTITASGLTLPTIKSMNVTIASQNREQLQIGSDDLAGVALGQFMVSGTLGLYFDSIDEYNAIKNHTSVAIAVPLGSVTGEKYTLEIPVAKFMSGDPTSGGNGNDIAFDVEFQGQYSSSDACTLIITRAIV